MYFGVAFYSVIYGIQYSFRTIKYRTCTQVMVILFHKIIHGPFSICFPPIVMFILGSIFRSYPPMIVISSNPQCQPNISRHYDNPFGKYSQQVNILKKTYYKSFSSLLESCYGGGLESHLHGWSSWTLGAYLVFLRDFPD